jgi:hypothetical protein
VLEGALAATDSKPALPGRIRVYKDEEFQAEFEVLIELCSTCPLYSKRSMSYYFPVVFK